MRFARPILFLVFLTPCVEFLTGSSSVIAALTVPSAAFTFFVLTWPSYALPVLLIREAIVVWNKGISSLLALGIAYGALNEGLLAKTYFAATPTSPVLGGGIGRWFGVNWPWVTEITLFHMIVSISVPVVLSFLIFPETRNQRFLSERNIRLFLALLLVEVLVILALQSIVIPAYRPVLPWILLPVAVVGLGVYLARRLPWPDGGRVLHGRFSRPYPLVLASLAFFVLLFIPIISFFPVAFIPDGGLSYWFYRLGPAAGVVGAIYPLGLAYLAIRFFRRHVLSDLQLAALVTGVMLIPLGTALSVHDFAQGDWAAALAYIAAIIVAARRSRDRGGSPDLPRPQPAPT